MKPPVVRQSTSSVCQDSQNFKECVKHCTFPLNTVIEHLEEERQNDFIKRDEVKHVLYNLMQTLYYAYRTLCDI